MNEKEIRKLGRAELLELLIAQTNRANGLERALEEANKKLEDRRIVAESSGDIAHAALELNGVFRAAQAAAEDYVESVRLKTESEYSSGETQLAAKTAEEILAEAKQEAERIIFEANRTAAAREAAADAYWRLVSGGSEGK